VIPALEILDHVALAPRTTLELGGPARFYLVARDEAKVIAALRWARLRGVPVGILGGGSNLVVSDEGFDGLVIEMALLGIHEEREGDRVVIRAAAGEEWDPLVARTVSAGLAGLECLSGIPGRVGATPIQNVGAYGQEVGERLRSVRVIDRETLEVAMLTPAECELGYRDSVFKRAADRYVVTEVSFALVPEGPATVRYAELERALLGAPDPSGLATVRDAVLALRRKKSMVIDEDDPNRRSAGSFFTNPIVGASLADRLVERAVSEGIASSAADVPRWPAAPAPDGTPRTKLAAGWLIERAGVAKGTRNGRVGISSKHALALVHHGGGTTSELLTLARRVRDSVHARFGVTLTPEPTLWGFALDPMSIA
jgi:UDP-N-acetylmuramate dehydrogenase